MRMKRKLGAKLSNLFCSVVAVHNIFCFVEGRLDKNSNTQRRSKRLFALLNCAEIDFYSSD